MSLGPGIPDSVLGRAIFRKCMDTKFRAMWQFALGFVLHSASTFACVAARRPTGPGIYGLG
jgi:hypothetical protein